MPIKTLLFVMACLIAVPSFCANLSSSQEKMKVYTVHKGDSLWKISKETLGNGSKWALLYAANQEAIQNPNLIFPGQNIVIPAGVSKGQLQQAMALAQKDSGRSRRTPRSASSVPRKTKETAPPVEKALEGSATPAATPVPEPPRPTSGKSPLLLIVLALLALGSGFYFWSRKGSRGSPQTQRPEPIASYRPPPPPPQTPTPAPKLAEPVTPAALPVAASAAEAFVQQGRYMEAAKVYRTILETDPGNVEIGKKLIRVEELMRTRTADLAAAQSPSPSVPGPTSLSPAPLQTPGTPPVSKPPEPASFSATITSISDPSETIPTPPADPAENRSPDERAPPASPDIPK